MTPLKPFGTAAPVRGIRYGYSNRGKVSGEWRIPRGLPAGKPIWQRDNAVTDVKDVQPPGPYSVQGYRASDLEYRTYRMLHKLGWTDRNIDFQTSILGGRNPGGQVLDYVIYGPGLITVINVNGDHWHGFGLARQKAIEYEARIRAVAPSAQIVSLYSSDLATDELAYANLLRVVGRGM